MAMEDELRREIRELKQRVNARRQGVRGMIADSPTLSVLVACAAGVVFGWLIGVAL